MRLNRARQTRLTVVVSLAASLLHVGIAAAAVSVTNRDEKDHKITIIEGEKKQDYTLKSNQALENICPEGCILRLNDNEDDDYQLEPKDVVSIEDGALFYDSPDDDDDDKPEEPKKSEEPKKN